MSKLSLTIDGARVTAEQGEKLLFAALDAGVYIPHLCAARGQHPPFAACRLCFVEVEGRSAPVAACSTPVTDGMAVRTDTPAVRRLVKGGFELLLSTHRLDCRNCPAHKRRCELQEIARRLRIRLSVKRVPHIWPDLPVDDSHPLFTLNQNYCILCGLCVSVCREKGKSVLGFAGRGLRTTVGTFAGRPLALSGCDGCLECVRVCPVAALWPKPEAEALVFGPNPPPPAGEGKGGGERVY